MCVCTLVQCVEAPRFLPSVLWLYVPRGTPLGHRGSPIVCVLLGFLIPKSLLQTVDLRRRQAMSGLFFFFPPVDASRSAVFSAVSFPQTTA